MPHTRGGLALRVVLRLVGKARLEGEAEGWRGVFSFRAAFCSHLFFLDGYLLGTVLYWAP